MKKNVYWTQVLKPDNTQQWIPVMMFLMICQWLSLPLKTFVRKSFGERYFSIVLVCVILVALAIYPLWATGAVQHLVAWYQNFRQFGDDDNGGYHYSPPDFEWWKFIKFYASWYLLLWLCLRQSLKRQKEIKREPSVFDFERYSLSSGHIWPWFYTFKMKGKSVDVRQVEIIVEPVFFMSIGAGLLLFGQPIGAYILVAGFLNMVYMWRFYRAGDHFIMDAIDEMICNEDLASTFLDGRAESERGFRFYGQRPTDPDVREKVAAGFMDDDDEVAEAR